MSLWLIRDRDPFIIGDGRPNQGRSRRRNLPFPFPSTTAGAVRTRLGTDPESGAFTAFDRLDKLRQVRLRGPLLVRDTAEGRREFLAPAPMDALLLGPRGTDTPALRRLTPQGPPAGRVDPHFPEELELVGVEGEPPREKPLSGAPRWWSWEHVEQWLVTPDRLDGRAVVEAGLPAIEEEERLHVRIDSTTRTASEGNLFTTVGLRFRTKPVARGTLSTSRALALALDVDTPPGLGLTLRDGVAPVSGGRRLGWWEPWAATLPAPPPALLHPTPPTRVRVLLLTPAFFEKGWRPTIDEGSPLWPAETGIESLRLVAAAIGRPVTAGGWDYELRRPKRLRHLAPAGSVYWIDLEGSDEARRRYIEKLWMTTISDGPQERRDGFGLVVLGQASPGGGA